MELEQLKEIMKGMVEIRDLLIILKWTVFFIAIMISTLTGWTLAGRR